MKSLIQLAFGATFLCLTACAEFGRLAPIAAQPKTPIARNITSFGPSLNCMDQMLQKKNAANILISATPIKDRTFRIPVGADDMLINAINQMNRKSREYVFLDQALIREGSLFELQTHNPRSKFKHLEPRYYIRGAISQLDADTHRLEAGITFEPLEQPEDSGFLDGSADPGLTNSVVTVDLHLVAFPSRRVLPGASVSNSMVVSRRRFGAGYTGLVRNGTLGITLRMDQIESNGQAVRNLIELGVIELLGQHAGVPYWKCLALDSTNAVRTAWREKAVLANTYSGRMQQAIDLMIELGWLNDAQMLKGNGVAKEVLARYQAQRGLIANGIPDFDTIQALRRELATRQPAVEPTAPTRSQKPPTSTTKPKPQMRGSDGYQSIEMFLDPPG